MDKREHLGTVLLVEDDQPQRKTLAGFLKRRGYNVVEAGSAAEAQSVADGTHVDLLLTDLRLGGPDGISLLTTLRQNQPDLQAVVLTAYGTVEDAVRAMRAGVYDFLTKPVDLTRLEAVLTKALERAHLGAENRGLRAVITSSKAFDDVVGQSVAIQRVKDLAAKVAPSRASVLVLGESGTGKEVLARAIHRASTRWDKPFVTVNCAVLPETLIEAELFGHVKGAFTGAHQSKRGRFELANGGTLFLDEVGDIPLPVQVKLLNVIQSGTFERVGATESVTVDVRIIAATHRDLNARIKAELFREDLYYRLNVVSITVPPLRERADDIPLLAQYFLRKHADLAGAPVTGLSDDVLMHLARWPFPGNIRELENWMERAVVLADGPVLTLADFPPHLSVNEQSPVAQPAESSDMGLEEQVARLEMRLIREALQHHDGNKSAAARNLKLTERAIRYKMIKYGL